MTRNLDLKLLEAFETAARHVSFTRAAQELNVLQPAVSRKISQLEKDLGVTLFLRTKPNLTLTPEGEALYAGVSSGLEKIKGAAEAIRANPQTDALVVNTSIGFASCYLMPRLAAFGRAYPNIELELVTRDQNRSFDPELCDVIVMFGDDDLPGVVSKLIFPEELIAVTGADHGSAGAMLMPEELVGERLLHLSDHYHSGDWDRYFSGTGVKAPDAPRSQRFTSFMVYLQAAINGEGIALGWRYLLDDLVASRRLHVVSAHKYTSTRGYYCCVSKRGKAKPAAKAFLEWISAGE